MPKISLLIENFSKALDSIHRVRMEQIRLAYGLPEETVTGIAMLYKNGKTIFRLSDGDADFFDIVALVLLGDNLALYLFMLCLDNVFRKSIDLIKENGFTFLKSKKQTKFCRNPDRRRQCR